jgi:hypothetical protein
LISGSNHADVPFADAERARGWITELMARSRCEL